MEAAHDIGLGHRSGEGAEGSEALREPVERGLSQGLRDQNQKLVSTCSLKETLDSS